MKSKTVTLQLSQIINKFDVRTKLDEDRVIQLAEAYEGDIQLPPVDVIKLDNEDSLYAYVDGRHRGAAREFLNLKDIEAVVLDSSLNDNPTELFALALEANYGGAKPPTREDIIHTITRMLEAGCDRTSIKERLTFLPTGAVRAFTSQALGTIQKRRVTKALDAIADGATMEVAAKTFRIKPDMLKNVIQGKKGKWGKNRSEEVQFSVEVKAYISAALRSANTGIGKKIDEVFRRVEDGEMSHKLASEVLAAWSEHLRNTSSRIRDRQARLDAISQNVEKS